MSETYETISAHGLYAVEERRRNRVLQQPDFEAPLKPGVRTVEVVAGSMMRQLTAEYRLRMALRVLAPNAACRPIEDLVPTALSPG